MRGGLGEKTRAEDLRAYAAEGASVTTEYVEVASGVALRCVRFTPTTKAPFDTTLDRALDMTPDTPLPTLVFVPGWISLLNTWRHFLPHVTSEFPVIYVESREKSSSRVEGRAGFAVADLASDLVRVLEHYGLQEGSFVLAGSSLGATTIVEALPFLPSQPAAAALILPNAAFDLPTYARLLRFVPHSSLPPLKHLARWVMFKTKINPDDAGQQERFVAALGAADAVKLKESTLGALRYRMKLEDLRPLPYPGLVLGASKDRQHDQEAVREIAAALGARYEDLETFTASHSTAAARVLVSFVQRSVQPICRH